jgi:hypothetical protein
VPSRALDDPAAGRIYLAAADVLDVAELHDER